MRQISPACVQSAALPSAAPSAQRPLLWFAVSAPGCGAAAPADSVMFSNPNPHADVKVFVFLLCSVMFFHRQSLSQENRRVLCNSIRSMRFYFSVETSSVYILKVRCDVTVLVINCLPVAECVAPSSQGLQWVYADKCARVPDGENLHRAGTQPT